MSKATDIQSFKTKVLWYVSTMFEKPFDYFNCKWAESWEADNDRYYER